MTRRPTTCWWLPPRGGPDHLHVRRAAPPAARARLWRRGRRGATTPAEDRMTLITNRRVLTGDRPTGPLHIGHYFGTLENRVRLQRAGAELFVLIADYQTLTDRDATARLRGDVLEQLAHYLAVGIDPDRATIFVHSAVAALNQLVLPFLSLVTVAELSRNPTVKAEIAATSGRSTSALMLAYPVH